MRRRDYLGQFELMVLLAVISIDEAAYGVPIARKLEAASGREVGLGSVYAALERLEEKSLVSSRMGDATPERGGRAKQYFEVTSAGHRAAHDARRTFTRLWRRVPDLKERTA
jgi:PadR family transcriptional regulator, regulatory protein PadR